MKTEPDILEEVQLARETVLAAHDYDIRACAKALNAEAEASGCKLVTRVVKARPKARFHGRTSRQHREAALALL